MGTYVSLHGRALGFDTDAGKIQRPGSPNYDDQEGVTVASTAANIKYRGHTLLSSTAAGVFTLNAPIAEAIGMIKRLTSLTTSTAAKTVRLASGNFQTTAGSTGSLLTFNGLGQNVVLQVLSTALVQLQINNGATLST